MKVIVSSVFRIILFPFDGKIVTVDQLSFYTLDYSSLPSSSIPLVGGVPDSYVSISIGLLNASSLMDCFPLQQPKVSQMVHGSYRLLQTLTHIENKCHCHQLNWPVKPFKLHLHLRSLWFRPMVPLPLP